MKKSIDTTTDDLTKAWVLKSTLNFTRYFFKCAYKRRFVIGQHHKEIADALDEVLSGKTTRLLINLPPRYGKTELAVKHFLAMGFAVNPKSRFIHLSYSDDLVRDNSKGVQGIMAMPEFQRFFPNVKPSTTNSRKWFTPDGGGLYAVSSAGQVTGFGAGLVDMDDKDLEDSVADLDKVAGVGGEFGGAIVIDDPIKPDDAFSDLIREKVNQKFETTIRNRVNSRNTPIIIIMQRLHEHDLCGYLMETEPDQWKVISLPVLYNDEKGNECALWPFKHTVEELHKLRDINPFVFETQYMQNPKPLEGLMYSQGFRTYSTIPQSRHRVVKAYCDSADTGADYLCDIIFVETETANYVLDVLYTQKPMEYTEPKTAERYTKYNVQKAVVESNNGGRGFARNVEAQCRLMGNNKTQFYCFTQSGNKQVRIFTHSADVQNMTYFPEGWERLWPEFHSAIMGYLKEGRNAHDDAPDALTGTVEHRDMTSKENINAMKNIIRR